MKKDDIIKIINDFAVPPEQKEGLIAMLEKDGLTDAFLIEFKRTLDGLRKKIETDRAEEIKTIQKIYEDAENELRQANDDFEKQLKSIEERSRQNYTATSKKMDELDLQRIKKEILAL